MSIIKQLLLGISISALFLSAIIPYEMFNDYKQYRMSLGKYEYKVSQGILSVTQKEYDGYIKAVKDQHKHHILCSHHINNT